MAKAGVTLNFTYYQHRDPVTGEIKGAVRSAHSRQSSPRLQAHKRCVAEGMRGTHVGGGDARQDSIAIREKFAQVSKGCARGGSRRASA